MLKDLPSGRCKSCGYIHPPPLDNRCGLKRKSKKYFDVRNVEVEEICDHMKDKLYEVPPDVYIKTIKTLKTMFGIKEN